MKFLQHKLLRPHRKWVCRYKPCACVRDGVCARLLLLCWGCCCTDTIGKCHCHAQLVPTLLLCWRVHCWRSAIVPLAYDTFNSSTVWGASQINHNNATTLSLCYLIMVDTHSWGIGMNPDLKGHWDNSSKLLGWMRAHGNLIEDCVLSQKVE